MPRTRETLSTLFAPPREDLMGGAGVLCAYSAEAEILERILHRFTGVCAASRVARGSNDLTLMLDTDHAVIPVGVVPGLVQLYPYARERSPVAAAHMHAKVALLGFGEARRGRPSVFRLIVSTGNWTHESASRRVEMVWRLDVAASGAEVADRRDLWSVATFLSRLLTGYQRGGPLTRAAEGLLGEALGAGTPPGPKTRTRFIHTLPRADGEKGQPLWHEVRRHLAASGAPCNLLVCGSGSFEQVKEDHTGEPEVLGQIATDLIEHQTLTRSARKFVVSNGGSGDQVTAAFAKDEFEGWTLCKPDDPSPEGEAERALHAKFLFVARQQGGSLFDARLYLGSGNLSHPGFLLRPPAGNVEAGVVLETPDLANEKAVRRSLPWGRPFRKGELAQTDAPVDEEPEASYFIPPPPILAFERTPEGVLRILWAEPDPGPSPERDLIEVIVDGQRIALTRDQEWMPVTLEPAPRYLEVHVGELTYKVPCLDASGAFPRQDDPAVSFEDWLDQLRAFPAAFHDPAEDEDDSGGEGEIGGAAASGTTPRPTAQRDFPARTAMSLVEEIAVQAGEVPEAQAPDWLAHLELQLRRVPEHVRAGWRSLGVNFLSILHHREGFAPDWKDLAGYQSLVDRVAEEWGMASSPGFEVQP